MQSLNVMYGAPRTILDAVFISFSYGIYLKLMHSYGKHKASEPIKQIVCQHGYLQAVCTKVSLE